MKIYVNRLPVRGPWGGGNAFVHAAYEMLPQHGHQVIAADDSRVAPDAMLLAGIDNDGYGISAEQAVMYKSVMSPHRDVKLVLRVNENDARKGTTDVDKMLIALSHHVDGTVFVSRWLQEYFEKKGWGCTNNTVIINGVDREVFKSQSKLNNGKVNIAAHHWSDNSMKGADIYEELDKFVGQNPDKFAFTYIGRHKCNFKNTTVVRPLSGKRLGEELGKHDVYVSASRWDPGPNHVLESLACGLPTFVHTDGGGAVEFAGDAAQYHSWEELKRDLLANEFPKIAQAQPLTDWQTCVKQYSDFLETSVKGIP